MSVTLTFKDSITRTGYTRIDGVVVVQHTCTIDSDNPEKITLSSTKLNPDLYRENRDICRADIAEFEDSCYELQKKYLPEEETE